LTPGAAELISFVMPKQLDTSRTTDRQLQSESERLKRSRADAQKSSWVSLKVLAGHA